MVLVSLTTYFLTHLLYDKARSRERGSHGYWRHKAAIFGGSRSSPRFYYQVSQERRERHRHRFRNVPRFQKSGPHGGQPTQAWRENQDPSHEASSFQGRKISQGCRPIILKRELEIPFRVYAQRGFLLLPFYSKVKPV